MKLMPTVTEVAHRKSTMTARISSAETNAESIKLSMEQMRLEAETIEEQRLELQARLNPLEMVLIPAGRFRMGTNTMVKGRTDETPEHSVRLKEFYIDKYEVTNIQYKEFIETTGYRSPPHWRNRTFPEARKSDHPVVNVSWDDAVAYGTWIGKRLPTEAEWERAALGSGTQEYPWKKAASTEYANYENAVGGTTSVAKYSKGQSPDGVWDMCGNVGEWVSDWYDDKYYSGGDSADSAVDPVGPTHGHDRVYRGGGFQGNKIDVRGKTRQIAMPSASNEHIGFRCAMDAEAGS
jgi:sulfatase modifying factor 1